MTELNAKALESRAAPTWGPFTAEHLLRAVAANVVGAALVFTGWWVASGARTAAAELGWFNLCIVGLLLAATGNGLLLAGGRRAVRSGRIHVFADTASSRPTRQRQLAPINPAVGLVAGPAMSHYHRSDCLLVSGKSVTVADRTTHERAGLSACEVCRP